LKVLLASSFGPSSNPLGEDLPAQHAGGHSSHKGDETNPSLPSQGLDDLREQDVASRIFFDEAKRLAQVVQQKAPASGKLWTERIDRFLLDPLLGIPVFFLAVFMVFKFSFDLANPFVDWLDLVLSGPLSNSARQGLVFLSAPEWVQSSLIDGVLSGVGFVLAFTPVIAAILFFLGLLEACGYMARAAFVMDRVMQWVGLPGKAFIPLVIGFGCNVPSIYATRTLSSMKDRILTSLIVPFMSCGARLPVYVLFAGAFFPGHRVFVLWFLYFFGIVMALLSALILRPRLFPGNAVEFLMEVPPYRIPVLKQVLVSTWGHVRHFIEKAGTFLVVVSLLVWVMLHFPLDQQHKGESLLGQVSHVIAPVFSPLGFGTWEASAALMTGIIAKEVVVSTWGELLAQDPLREVSPSEDIPSWSDMFWAFGEAVKSAFQNLINPFGSTVFVSDAPEQSLQRAIQDRFTPLSALSYLVFILLYMPCVVTGFAMKQEFQTWRWYGLAIVLGFSVAYLSSFLLFQVGRLMGWG
jgi:ferrous iron transport protein B